jgi:hypothetical protein
VSQHPGTPFTITYRETATFPLSSEGPGPLRHLVVIASALAFGASAGFVA